MEMDGPGRARVLGGSVDRSGRTGDMSHRGSTADREDDLRHAPWVPAEASAVALKPGIYKVVIPRTPGAAPPVVVTPLPGYQPKPHPLMEFLIEEALRCRAI